MTIKDRLKVLIKQQGISNFAELHFKIRKEIGDEDPRGSAEKYKGNFSKYLNGERSFPVDYVIPLEKILKTSFTYIMEGKEDYKVDNRNPYHFETVAAQNDYNEFVELSKRIPLVRRYDEYEKSIFDYIVSYRAVEGIRCFIKELGFHYDAKYGHMELLCKGEKADQYVALDEKQMLEIARLLAEKNEGELFVRLFDGFELTKLTYFSGKTIFELDEFFEIILQSDRVLESLKDKRMLSIDDINIGMMKGVYSFKEMLFTNPLLTPLLYRLVERGGKVDVLISLLDFAIKENKTLLADIAIKRNNGQFKNLHLDEEQTGFILDGYYKIGNLIVYDLPIDPALPSEVKKRLKEIKEQEEQINISDRFLLNEQGKTAFRIQDGKMLANHVSNKTMYEMYRDMNNAKIPVILEYIDTEDGTDSFGFDEEECVIASRLSHEQIISTVRALKVLHQAMSKKYGDKIIIHGDLLKDSLVFSGTELRKIIHWDNCRFGTREEELITFIYQLFEPSFRHMDTYGQNEKINIIRDILNEYADEDVKNEFGNKMIAFLEKECQKLDRSNKEVFTLLYTQISFAKAIIEVNLTELNNL